MKEQLSTRSPALLMLLPGLAIYSVFMVWPIMRSISLSFQVFDKQTYSAVFVGIENYISLFTNPNWSDQFWNSLINNIKFFAFHMAVQNPVALVLAALISNKHLRFASVYRTIIFIPAILSFVIVGFTWRLILSPSWGVAESLLSGVGLEAYFEPWLGKPGYALFTLSLISVWQCVGIPMMLLYAALLSIPEEILDAAECEGIVGVQQFFAIKLPLLWPTIGLVSILTFVGNFNAFDLIFVTQGPFAGPDGSTDLLGTFLFRVFFGNTTQTGDPYMGSAIASIIFLLILSIVSVYLYTVQRRLTVYKI